MRFRTPRKRSLMAHDRDLSSPQLQRSRAAGGGRQLRRGQLASLLALLAGLALPAVASGVARPPTYSGPHPPTETKLARTTSRLPKWPDCKLNPTAASGPQSGDPTEQMTLVWVFKTDCQESVHYGRDIRHMSSQLAADKARLAHMRCTGYQQDCQPYIALKSEVSFLPGLLRIGKSDYRLWGKRYAKDRVALRQHGFTAPTQPLPALKRLLAPGA